MNHPSPLGAPRSPMTPGPGWPTRGAVWRDALLTLGFGLLLIAESHTWSVMGVDPPLHTALGSALLVCVVLLSRLYPLLAPCLALVVSFWVSAFSAVLVCAAYLAGRRSPRVWPAVLLFTAMTVVSMGITWNLAEETPGLWLSSGVMLVLFTAVPWLVGVYRRQQEELSETGWEQARRLRREQRLTADRARLRERSRIAQDMHDSLGHELSLIALRAGALEVAPDLEERHREKIAELRAGAVSATAHLREIIGVLRADDETDPAPTAPAGESVVALVERARDSGMRVMLVSDGRPGDLPPMIDRTVYRVVQESLTNATKYAPGARIGVWLTADERRLEVRVTNSAPQDAGTGTVVSGNHGLIGLRERVRLSGGTFAAGPYEGGWEVCAILPLDGDAVPEQEPERVEAAEIDRLQRDAGRGVRNWTLALLATPVLLALVGVGGLYYLLSVLMGDSTLPPEDYAEISVGQTRGELEERLPEIPMLLSGDRLDDFVDADPECDHYRSTAGLFDTDPTFYQLCYQDGELVAKEELRER